MRMTKEEQKRMWILYALDNYPEKLMSKQNIIELLALMKYPEILEEFEDILNEQKIREQHLLADYANNKRVGFAQRISSIRASMKRTKAWIAWTKERIT